MSRPDSIAAAIAAPGEYRAGNTDLGARRRLGISSGEVVDLDGIAGLDGVESVAGGIRIGATTRISDLVASPLMVGYPALTATAASLATPQIRAMATVGGNLLQRNRCPYYRHPGFECFKSGEADCPARDGDHSHGVIFDLGPCVAPHPSSLAMALLLYEGELVVTGGPDRTVTELLGDGRDGTRDHQLEPGAILTAITLPPPEPGEMGGYRRATARRLAEWPIVEAAARVTVNAGKIDAAAVAVGGVAPVPLSLEAVAAVLAGSDVDDTAAQDAAASRAADGATPLTMSAHKVPLLVSTVKAAITAALAGSPPDGERAFGEHGLSVP